MVSAPGPRDRPRDGQAIPRDHEYKMTVLLASRAAEELVFGEVSTGARDDLQRASHIACAMVACCGMDKKLGRTAHEAEHGNFLGQSGEGGGRRFSEDTARESDLAVRELVEAANARARHPAAAPRLSSAWPRFC